MKIRKPHQPETLRKMSEIATARHDARLAAQILSGVKICKHCGIEKSLTTDFQKATRRNGGVGYSSWCKACGALQLKTGRLAACFNLTIPESESILTYQNGCCAICRQPISNFKRDFAVDHDHATGLIRGRLCWFCNKLLGIAQDSPERLFAALVYLLKPPAVDALGTPRFGMPGRAGTKAQKRLRRRLEKKPHLAIPQTFQPIDVVKWIFERLNERNLLTVS